MDIPAPAGLADMPAAAERWTSRSILVLVICFLAWSFDIYEQTIMQLVTPLLIKEWGISLATIGKVTTYSRWAGFVGILVFPILADRYGRKPLLIASVLGYSLLTGLTGFVQGPMQLLVAVSATRVALSGEQPVGVVMVAETAPIKWRATALAILVSGYPFGYMLTSLAGLFIVPHWGWRALYWIGILPAILVFFVAFGIKESPRFERATAAMARKGGRTHLDLIAPFRHCPREMVIGMLVYFFYQFTWIGWSYVMPQFLTNEKHLGFETTTKFLTIWMFVAIFAYWICGWLCDKFGRRYVIPVFAVPAAVLLALLGHADSPTALFLMGGAANCLIIGCFGVGLGYIGELFPTVIRGTAYGSVAFFAGIASSFSPLIVGNIATTYSIGACLPLLGLCFFLLGPLFLFVARETTRHDLTDFVGERAR